MPALGMNQTTGKILTWLKGKGDPVKIGDPVMEVETDKAVVEVEAQVAGVLIEIRHAAGSEVPVGHVVAVIGAGASVLTSADDAATAGGPTRAEQAKATEIKPAPIEQRPAAPIGQAPKEPSTAPPATDRLLISPKARKEAARRESNSVSWRNWAKAGLTMSWISTSLRRRLLHPRRSALSRI